MWHRISDDTTCYGIAIHNYNETKEYRIPLTVGETVHILEEIDDWFRGYALNNKSEIGIFPKCYVHIIDQEVEQNPVVQEITAVLREWGTHWKHLYVTNNSNFEQIQNQIYELVRFRSKILSGTLPIDELKELKKIVTAKIDMGNKILGLDLVVRDEQGNLLNSDSASTIQLFHHHRMATDRIKKATSEHSPKPIKNVVQYSHIFFVSVRHFICKMSEDSELLMTLYDAKERRAITENYVVRWSKEGLAFDLDQLHNLRVLFTDLGSADLQREKIYLVCYVVRVGSMETKEIDHRRSSVQPPLKKGQTEGVRRPFGVAAMDVTPYMSGKLESDS